MERHASTRLRPKRPGSRAPMRKLQINHPPPNRQPQQPQPIPLRLQKHQMQTPTPTLRIRRRKKLRKRHREKLRKNEGSVTNIVKKFVIYFSQLLTV